MIYGDANWIKIAAYLRSENFSKIRALNRGQIINDITELIIQKVYRSIDIFRNCNIFISRNGLYSLAFQILDWVVYTRYVVKFQSSIDPISNVIYQINDSQNFPLRIKSLLEYYLYTYDLKFRENF